MDRIAAKFFQAAKERDVETLKKCIAEKVNPKMQLTSGDTAMHYLLSEGCFCEDCTKLIQECLFVLLENNADPSVPNRENVTPLDLIVDNMVSLSLDQQSNSNANTEENNSSDNRSSSKAPASRSLRELLLYQGGSLFDRENPQKKGIANYILTERLVNEMPEVMKAVLDEGVSFAPPEPFEHLQNQNSNAKGQQSIELDWSYLVYSQDALSTPERNKQWHETEFLRYVMEADKVSQKAILHHPLVQAYLDKKKWLYWKYFGSFYFAFIFVTFMLYLAFIWILYNDDCRYDESTWGTSTSKPSSPVSTSTSSAITINAVDEDEVEDGFRCVIDAKLSVLAYVVLALYTVGPLLVELRELMAIGFKTYFRDWQNYVIIIATFVTATTLFPALTMQHTYNFNWEYGAAATGMLMGSWVILIQLSSIPAIAVYVQMVFKTFQRITLATIVLSPILIGFYFAFRILITDQENHSEISVFRMLTMIVNGGDYEEFIDRSRGDYYTIVAYFFFGAFIVLIVIVVLNLLIGLAVSDIQELKESANLNNIRTKIRNFYLMDTFFGRQWGRNSVTCNGTVMTIKFRPLDKTDTTFFKRLKLELLGIARKKCIKDIFQDGNHAAAAYAPLNISGFGNYGNNVRQKYSIISSSNI